MRIDKTTSKRPAPFSLRLTFQERAKLEELAGDMSLSSFIKEYLFKSNIPKKKRRRRPVKDKKLLAQLLAILGKSRLSQNMNQLAKASNTGTLPLPRQVEAELRQACADIRYMRNLLMKGLGLRVDEKNTPKPSLQTEFAQAAADIRDISNIRPMRPQP